LTSKAPVSFFPVSDAQMLVFAFNYFFKVCVEALESFENARAFCPVG
jgi:hypothetical protein